MCATVLPLQICYGPFINLTETFSHLVVLPNSPSEFVADALDCPHFDRRVRVLRKNLRLLELALVLVRPDYVASRVVDMDHCMMRAAAVHRVADCVAERVRPIIPGQPSRYDFRRYKNPPRA